jgi:hypothetical protein
MSSETDTHETIEKLLKTAFSMCPLPRLYNEHDQGKKKKKILVMSLKGLDAKTN